MKKESGNTLKRSLLSVLVTSALCTPHAMAAFTPSVPNGETVTGEVVENGTQTIQAGGEADRTTINADGVQNVNGTASDTAINNGGTQKVFGTASDTAINNGGWQIVKSEGTASDTTINGGKQEVNNGGMASDTTINNGGLMMTTGTDSDTTVQAGGRYILGKYTSTPDDPDAAWTYADTATAQNLTVTGGTAQVSAGTLTGA
ncbi:hypothetical protein DFY03_24835, partial [Escherichia coli]|nr:hypothetical protein [Escherichia coli]